ncbi:MULTISPECIES: DEAD/DEAH box helicase [unclassified Imperialibacter]|uniref:DEAD/DEAH box helicase n=1 Tax=unclassified Imperialibacter TaxID=2629706 RepID=UPI00125ACAC3|nr:MULTISPECIES: DEAD/DEAH box helicase [unclassified Imperialibacter]CAD5268576.1 ATP-dependent RNA helicase RhlE [Imperialibacter sp. 89]CAD5297030.1 ATP-dependent RNA helicase RhlE [Imperialibacter sp. 75]VVT34000.1 ATP-dependent RNA helicase RhlE [Imperialibacter sp. EC-SDR9]
MIDNKNFMEESAGFESFKLNKQLLNAIADLGYKSPTPIQAKAIPVANAGHDLFGIAQTGTGKTAAYLIPILLKIKYAQGNDPRALILAPTRELVMQIEENARKLATYTDLRVVGLYGGKGPKLQIEELKKGVDLIVATPGRFTELYHAEAIHPRQIKTLVLDEADRMMDMGFMPQIRKILEVIPVKRQNMLFSATMPEKVVKLSEEFLEFPQTVEVAPQSSTLETIEQRVYLIPNFKTKIHMLNWFLHQTEAVDKVIIFTKTKDTANNLYKFIHRKINPSVKVIHGNKDQNARINAFEAFKAGDSKILVATDVSSRGLDVSMVSHVINFDVPVLYEDYVHRIGRTGRIYKAGSAWTFVNPAEEYHLRKIEELIRKQISVHRLPKDLIIEETPFEEQQDMAREVDHQKRKDDPDFKGAFHDKKHPKGQFKKPTPKKNKRKKR